MLETEDRPTGDQSVVPRRRSPGRWLLVAAAVVVAVVGTVLVAAGRVVDDQQIDVVTPAPTVPTVPVPLPSSHTSADGEVTVSTPSIWEWFGVAPSVTDDHAGVWFGLLYLPGGPASDGSYTIGLVDPVAYDAWCAEMGGSPLLTGPADAAAIAQQLIADPNFETTAPVAARIGGVEALSMDVTLAPGGEPCGVWVTDIARWVHTLWPGSGMHLRLYLVDLPEGMSVQTLAITVVAPKEGIEEFLAETAPIIESIEFHPN
jgi:hypothetical protein